MKIKDLRWSLVVLGFVVAAAIVFPTSSQGYCQDCTLDMCIFVAPGYGDTGCTEDVTCHTVLDPNSPHAIRCDHFCTIGGSACTTGKYLPK